MNLETSSAEQDASVAQERLFQLLQSVRLDRVSPALSETPQPSACPKCGHQSFEEHRTWCAECHYSPQLGRKITKSEIFRSHSPKIPPRVKILGPVLCGVVSGCGVLTLGAMACRSFFPLECDQGNWGRLLFFVGLLMVSAAHARAYLIRFRAHYLQAANASRMVSLFNLVGIWAPLLRSENAPRLVVYGGAWGLAAMVLSVTVVGVGVQNLASHLQKLEDSPHAGTVMAGTSVTRTADEIDASDADPMPPSPAIAALSTDPGTQLAALTPNRNPNPDEVEQPARQPAREPAAEDLSNVPLAHSGEKRTKAADCLILGYTTNAQGQIRSILIAEATPRGSQFVGRVRLDQIDPNKATSLQQLLDRHRTTSQWLKLGYQARWVMPVVRCRIAYVNRTREGMIRDGYLLGFGDDQTPESSEPRSDSESSSS